MTTGTITSPRRAHRLAQGQTRFRPEIQGLRSVAVLMVVAYHVWFGKVSGGVDVFLLISAFLMTLQFTNKFAQLRSIDLMKHWLHLFRRLLPAATVVISATLLATFLFVPKTRWLGIIEQGWASLFYVQNWLLKAQAVDYYAEDHSLASPLQHFWSLSLQGQVFILWPLIFCIAAITAKAFRLRYRGLLAYIFAAIFLASLGFSVFYTNTSQAEAYFDSGARLWEFALGSLVALVLPGLTLSKPVRVVMGWVGIAAMLSCGFLLQVQTAFPGFVALWPTLAASAIIMAGQTGSRIGVDRILSSRILVKLGDNSYALYLWHWPVLVIYLIWSGKEHAGWLSGTVVVGASLLLAFLTTRFLERPWRQWAWPEVKRRRAVIAVLLAATVAVVPLSGWRYLLDEENRALLKESERNNPGAKALLPGYVDRSDPDAGILPTADRLPKDWAGLDKLCEGDLAPGPGVLEKSCAQSVGVDDPQKRILILGNSHAEQWMAALEPLAKKNQWQLYSVLKGGCVYAPQGVGLSHECDDFNKEVDNYLEAHKPDAVVTVATAATPSSPDEKIAPGFADLAKRLTSHGIEVIGLRDNPRFTTNMADCVVSKGAEAPACNPARASVLPQRAAFDELKGTVDGLHLLDLSDLICTATTCPAQVGNMYVYLDNNHLSASYVETMSEEFGRRLEAVSGWEVN